MTACLTWYFDHLKITWKFCLRNLAGKLLNEDGMPPRQCIVIRAEREEEIGNASAVLVESTLVCHEKQVIQLANV